MTLLEKVSKLVNASYVHKIRCGDKHRFIDITIIEAEGRFFVRQYKFGKKSWYHAFLQNPKGEIKFGDEVFKIAAKIPTDLNEINPKINMAYHKKLPVIYFLMRLTYDRKKHESSTLELLPQDV